MPVSDEQLTDLSRSGDEPAFDEIVKRYQGLLLRHCTRVTSEAQAQDAVQDTFLTAWTALRAGVEVRTLRPWLFTIAHRKALASLRDHRGRWSELSESLTDDCSSADAVDRSERVREALVALAQLPVDQRTALVSSAVHGRSGHEIARSMGIDDASVRQLVHRARASVRAAAAACVLPPVLFVRRLRGAAQSIRRLALTAGPTQADTTTKLLKAGVAALAVAATSGGALEIAKPSHHAPQRASAVLGARAPSSANTPARRTGSLRRQSVDVPRKHAARAAQSSTSASTPASAAATFGASAQSSAAAKAQSMILQGVVPAGLSVPSVSLPAGSVALNLGTTLTGTVAGATGGAGQIVKNAAKPVVSTVTNVVAATVTQTVPTVGASGSDGLVVAGG
jgi:RNA polymerase sigma factor (sigma-70 family)